MGREDSAMKKMLILAMTMAMVLLAAAGVCETLRVGMECNYAPYNWTQRRDYRGHEPNRRAPDDH